MGLGQPVGDVAGAGVNIALSVIGVGLHVTQAEILVTLRIGAAGAGAASLVIPADPGIGIRGGVDGKHRALAIGVPTAGVGAIENAAHRRRHWPIR
jgi:hypothetical protein